MTKRQKKALYDRAISRYSALAQVMVAIEEMAELTKELSRTIQGRGKVDQLDRIAEEVADVAIMLEQVANIYQIGDRVKNQMTFKLMRLEARMEKEGEYVCTGNSWGKFYFTRKRKEKRHV